MLSHLTCVTLLTDGNTPWSRQASSLLAEIIRTDGIFSLSASSHEGLPLAVQALQGGGEEVARPQSLEL